jgi:hypothetical protein
LEGNAYLLFAKIYVGHLFALKIHVPASYPYIPCSFSLEKEGSKGALEPMRLEKHALKIASLLDQETAEKLDKIHRSSGKTKTSLVQTALFVYLERGKDRPIFDKLNPLLEAMNDRILIDELRVRGYKVEKL